MYSSDIGSGVVVGGRGATPSSFEKFMGERCPLLKFKRQ